MNGKDWEPNMTGFEAIIRIIIAINLVGVISYFNWTYLIWLPFMLLVTSLTSFSPVKWFFRRRSGKHKGI